MFKYIYLLFVLLGIGTQLFAQGANISTKFAQDGTLYKTPEKNALSITEFKENQTCIVTAFLGDFTYKVNYHGRIGVVKDQYLFVNEQMMDLYYDHEEKARDQAIQKRQERQNKVKAIALKAQGKLDSTESLDLLAKKRADSINEVTKQSNRILEAKLLKEAAEQAKAEEKKQIVLQKRKDSITEVKIALKIRQIAQRKSDSISRVVNERNRALEAQLLKEAAAKAKAEEAKQIALQKRKDSISEAKIALKIKQLIQRKSDSVSRVVNERNRVLEAKLLKEAAAKAKAEEAKQIVLQQRKDSIAEVKVVLKLKELEQKKKDSIIKADKKKSKIFVKKQKEEVIRLAKQKEKVALQSLKRKNDSLLNIQAEARLALEKLRIRNDSVTKAKKPNGKEMQKFKEIAGSKSKNSNNSEVLMQKEKYDAILKVKEQERKLLGDLHRQKDSIAKIIEQERGVLEKLRNDVALVRETKETKVGLELEEKKSLEMLEGLKFRDACHYQINEFDKFYNITTIRTEAYQIANNLTAELYKQGKKVNVFFNFKGKDLGCVSYLPNQRSSVKITLENNQTVSFYHSWDIECDAFLFKADLTKTNIEMLRNTPIKLILIQGTKDSKEIKFIDYKTFFIDKLKCIQ